MADDFTPKRDLAASTRWLVKSVNHIKPDQLGDVEIGLQDLDDTGGGPPADGDTYIYNSVTNLFELGSATGPSWVDLFTVTDDATDTFTLTFLPLDDSWNVGMGWVWDEDNEFSLTGRTLTVLDPTSTFRGIADNGPRTLRVQYDYTPSSHPAFVGVLGYAGGDVGTVDFILPTGILPGDMMLESGLSWGGQGLSTGFTLVDSSTGLTQYKFITTEQPGDAVPITVGGGTIAAHVMTIVRGIDPSQPIVSSGGYEVANISITGAGNNIAVHHMCAFDGAAATIDRGVQQLQGSGGASGHGGEYCATVEDDLTGTVTVTPSTTFRTYIASTILRPA